MKAIALFAALVVTALAVAQARAVLLVDYSYDEASSGATTAFNTGTLGSTADGAFDGASTRTSNTPGGYSVGALNLNLNPNGTGPLEGVGPTSDIDALDALSTITVSTWVSVQGTRTVADNSYRSLVSDMGGGDGWLMFYDTVGSDDTQIRLGFQINSGPGHGPATATVLDDSDHSWLFLAVTWDQSTGIANLYYGTPSTPVTSLGTVSLPFTMLDNSAPMVVGNDGADSTPNAFMDDTRVYDNVLSMGALENVREQNLGLAPEPSSLALLVIGAAMVLRRKRSRA